MSNSAYPTEQSFTCTSASEKRPKTEHFISGCKCGYSAAVEVLRTSIILCVKPEKARKTINITPESGGLLMVKRGGVKKKINHHMLF